MLAKTLKATSAMRFKASYSQLTLGYLIEIQELILKGGSNYSDWACYAYLMNSRKFISPLLLLLMRMEIFFKVGEQRSVLLELWVKENSLFLFRKYAQIRAQASYFE